MFMLEDVFGFILVQLARNEMLKRDSNKGVIYSC